MEMIDQLKNVVSDLQLDARVEIKVLAKDLILLIDKKIKTIQDMICEFHLGQQPVDSVKEVVVFFEEKLEELKKELTFFISLTKDIKINYENVSSERRI